VSCLAESRDILVYRPILDLRLSASPDAPLALLILAHSLEMQRFARRSMTESIARSVTELECIRRAVRQLRKEQMSIETERISRFILLFLSLIFSKEAAHLARRVAPAGRDK
jgi:hypothetical protein